MFVCLYVDVDLGCLLGMVTHADVMPVDACFMEV